MQPPLPPRKPVLEGLPLRAHLPQPPYPLGPWISTGEPTHPHLGLWSPKAKRPQALLALLL